jgi:hypothetical protein
VWRRHDGGEDAIAHVGTITLERSRAARGELSLPSRHDGHPDSRPLADLAGADVASRCTGDDETGEALARIVGPEPFPLSVRGTLSF